MKIASAFPRDFGAFYWRGFVSGLAMRRMLCASSRCEDASRFLPITPRDFGDLYLGIRGRSTARKSD